MSETVGSFMLKRLAQWGIRRVYAYPGDGINGMLSAFEKVGGEPEFLQVRQEKIAAFAACAHATLTGEVTTGPCWARCGCRSPRTA